jgi:hypothetical protein
MSPQARTQLCQDLDLIERVAQTYQKTFGQLIGQMNTQPAGGDLDSRCIRTCVEAVSLMLVAHNQLARSLRDAV